MSLARTPAWINFRYGSRPLVWGALLAVLAVVLDFLPLVNLLGFDFSFVIGLFAALAGVDIGHGVVSAARRNRPAAGLVKLVFEAIACALATLALPLVLSLANAARVRNCNLGAGLELFFLLPVATATVAAGTGAAVALLVSRPRLGRVLAFAPPAISVAWSLVRLYRDPAVFAFDAYAGYFPGPIYDEALRPPLRLLWYRLANFTWLAALIATLNWLGHGGLRIRLRSLRALLVPVWSALLALSLIAASAIWYASRHQLGFHVTHASLAELLSRETRSKHFVLHSDPTAETDADIALAQEDLEFRYSELVHILGVEPQLPIAVYRFPSAAAKKDAVGAATTLFAKPWTREIYVQADRFPASRLRHEMAHVFASAFGDPVFGVALAWHFWGPLPVPRLATGLIEGVAEAADFDNPSGRLTTHEEAAAMIALGKAPPLDHVIGAGFSLESGPRAYTVAGSFCRFLLDRFGVTKLRAAFRSAGDFQQVYGVPLASLDADWRSFLASQPVDQDARAQAEEDFRRPAIFHKVCARELAARVSEARARMGTVPGESVALLSSVCGDDPGEPIYAIDLAEAWQAAGDSQRAQAALDAQKENQNLTRSLRFRAASLGASIAFHAGNLEACRAALADALANATDDIDERSARVKLRAIADEKSRASLGRVLFGDQRGRPLDPGLVVHLVERFAQDFPGEALGSYLVGRQLSVRDPRLAAEQFAAACPMSGEPPAASLEPLFLKECRRAWAESAYLAGDLSAAHAAASWLVEHSSREADRLRAQDFLARVAWKRSL
jgi:hypothetical protein